MNSLFVGSTVGVGCFIFYRKRVVNLPKKSRVLDSFCLACLFTCGTVLIFNYVNEIIPENKWIRIPSGVVSSVFLFVIGKNCSNEILDSSDGG